MSGALVPRLSATLLVLARAPASSAAGHQFKLLFIQRSRNSGFMASAHVFPGGVMDDADKDAAWASHTVDSAATGNPNGSSQRCFPIRSDKGDSLALRVCALRETFEETGLLLARPATAAAAAAATTTAALASAAPAEAALPAFYASAHAFPSLAAQHDAQRACSASAASFYSALQQQGLMLEPLKLAPWSRWITPTFEKRRYDTYFYLAALARPFESLSADAGEVAETLWLSPGEALELAEGGRIVLPPPTTYILRELAPLRTIEQVFAAAPSRELPALEPIVVEGPANDGCMHIALPGDPFYPAATNGDSSATSVAAVDPTDRTRWHRMVRPKTAGKAKTAIFVPESLRLKAPASAKL